GDCSWVKILIDDTTRHFDAEEEGVCAGNRSLALSRAFRNIGHSLSSSEILDRGKPNQQRRRGGGNRTTKRPSKFLDTKKHCGRPSKKREVTVMPVMPNSCKATVSMAEDPGLDI